MNQSIKIGGKEFKFRNPTLGFLLEIESQAFQKFLAEVGETSGFAPVWKKFILTAFESKWWWRFVLPKELQEKNILVAEFAEVQKSFFTYVEELSKLIGGSPIFGSSQNRTT